MIGNSAPHDSTLSPSVSCCVGLPLLGHGLELNSTYVEPVSNPSKLQCLDILKHLIASFRADGAPYALHMAFHEPNYLSS